MYYLYNLHALLPTDVFYKETYLSWSYHTLIYITIDTNEEINSRTIKLCASLQHGVIRSRAPCHYHNSYSLHPLPVCFIFKSDANHMAGEVWSVIRNHCEHRTLLERAPEICHEMRANTLYHHSWFLYRPFPRTKYHYLNLYTSFLKKNQKFF